MVKSKDKDLDTDYDGRDLQPAGADNRRAPRRAKSRDVNRAKSEKVKPRVGKQPAKNSKKKLVESELATLYSMSSMERKRMLDKKLSPFDLGMQIGQMNRGKPPNRKDQIFLQQMLLLRTQLRRLDEPSLSTFKYNKLMANSYSSSLPATHHVPLVQSLKPAPVLRKQPIQKPAPRAKSETRFTGSKVPKPKASKKYAPNDGYVRIKPPTSGKKQPKKKKRTVRLQGGLQNEAGGVGLEEIKEERGELDEGDFAHESSRKRGIGQYEDEVKIDEDERVEEPARVVQSREEIRKKGHGASEDKERGEDLIRVDVGEDRSKKEKVEKEKREKEEREKKEKKDREERERREKDERDRQEREEREKKEKKDKERKDKERQEREKQEKKDKEEREKQEREERERKDKEEKDRQERDRKEREKRDEKAKEKERQDREEREKLERERQERKEREEREERERQEKELQNQREEVPRKNLIVDDNIVYDDREDDLVQGDEEGGLEGNEEEELNEEMLRFYNEIPVLKELTQEEVDSFKHKMVEHIYKYQILNSDEYQSLFQAAYYKNKEVIQQEEMAEIFEDLAAALEQQGEGEEEEGDEYGIDEMSDQ